MIMSEKISSNVISTALEHRDYSVFFVKTLFNKRHHFQTLMEKTHKSNLPQHTCSKNEHDTFPTAGKAKENEWQRRDEGSEDTHKRKPKRNNKVTGAENDTNWKEQEKGPCHLSCFSSGIREITLHVTSDCFCDERSSKSGASYPTQDISLMQRELQELISKNVSRIEIQGTRSLSIQPRSDKLQNTLIEMQHLPNGGIAIQIATSSKESLEVIQQYFGMIRSRFLEVLPFRPLQLRLRYSGKENSSENET